MSVRSQAHVPESAIAVAPNRSIVGAPGPIPSNGVWVRMRLSRCWGMDPTGKLKADDNYPLPFDQFRRCRAHPGRWSASQLQPCCLIQIIHPTLAPALHVPAGFRHCSGFSLRSPAVPDQAGEVAATAAAWECATPGADPGSLAAIAVQPIAVGDPATTAGVRRASAADQGGTSASMTAVDQGRAVLPQKVRGVAPSLP